MRTTWLGCVLSALALGAAPAFAQCPATTPVQGAPPPAQVFPADNWWNVDIRNAPVDANSAAFIQWIGPNRGLHPDFGGEDTGDFIYGIPYAIVDGTQEKLPVTFEVWDESDGVNLDTGEGEPFYPIPVEAIDQAHWIEGGPAGTVDMRGDNDRHLLIVDCTNRHLYELYNVWFDESTTQWRAYSGAFFDLDTNARRPETWTSADASGMAIFPGLVRYDEAADPMREDLGHAIRMTTRDTNGYVYPASHDAGNGAGAPPLGARLRLKALVNGQDPALRTNDPIARRIMRTMQKYGMIIADNGSDMYFTGTFDTRWDNGILNPAFNLLKASDFEVVQLGWQPAPTGLPTLSIDNATVAEGNAGTKAMTFTVSLSHASDVAVGFNVATANGTALAGSDYVASSQVGRSIPAGELMTTFTVTVNGDTVLEADETLTATLSAPVNATILQAEGFGIIQNDDLPSLSIANASITEGDSGTQGLRFTLTLSQPSAMLVTYHVGTANGTALAGSDYAARSVGNQTFPPGTTTRIFDIVINGDTAIEPHEAFYVNVTNVVGATVADGQAFGTIFDDDAPTLSIADVAIGEGNAGSKGLRFTVQLSQPSSFPVTYAIGTANGSALAGSDYVARSAGGQGIPAGMTAKIFDVVVNGDTAVEGNESFLVNVTSVVGAHVADGQATGTLVNDDGPTLSIGDASVVEGAAGSRTLTFTVRLSQVAAGTVAFDVATANGSALAGSDYVASSLTGQTIAAGQLARTFAVTVNGDASVEANETLLAKLSAATGASILDAQGVGTIVNDDGPTLSVSDASITEGHGGTKGLRFTVSLSQAATVPVTYTIGTANGTALAGSDYVARSAGNQVIPAGSLSRIFDIVINGDTADEANEAFAVNLTNVTGVSVRDARGVGTILDDD